MHQDMSPLIAALQSCVIEEVDGTLKKSTVRVGCPVASAAVTSVMALVLCACLFFFFTGRRIKQARWFKTEALQLKSHRTCCLS
mmetsp:Transcript_106911/g.207234  ORF Transcript_106911/g.207234 Transcript_106911/m.207234 type:complete len:84 (+) Transcript_106911:82-333(+)